MKKTILIIFLVLLALLVVYIGFNQLDAPAARFSPGLVGDHVDTSSFKNFYESLLEQRSFDKNNGYFRLWTLTEAEGVDIEADEVILKYRRLYDPQFDNDKYIEEWTKSGQNWSPGKDYKGPYKPYQVKWKKMPESDKKWVNPPKDPSQDWLQAILSGRETVMEMQTTLQLFLDRYQRLVDCEVFQDFTLIRADFPMPHLLAWLQVAKMYNVVHMLEAYDGDWQKGVSHLLAHIGFAKKAVKGSRTLIVNLVAKAVLRLSLQGLASLMNQPEFPGELYEKIAAGLPPLEYDHFGTRVPLLLEGFNMTLVEKNHLLMQKNRTRQYYCDLVSKLVNSEKTPPFQWQSHPLENNKVKNGLFWWLQNPAGKIAFEKDAESKTVRNLFTVVFKSYSLKAIYDMTRISAELHRAYTPGKNVKEILEGLAVYRSWVDPGSGKPYIWDERKQVLYSIGTDRDDDGGKADYTTIDTDIVLPVVLYIKNRQLP